MGGLGSTRWGGYRKKVTVEQCAVLDARQLQATLGAAIDTTTGRAVTLAYTALPGEPPVQYTVWLVTQVGAQGGLRSWLYCPLVQDEERCDRRVERLYLVPGQRDFGCRQCLGLTYRSCQQNHLYDRLAQRLGMTPRQFRQSITGASPGASG